MAEPNLTDLVLEWKIGRRSTAEVTKAVCLAVWRTVSRRLSEDDRSEFILYFYRRIPGIIERYDPDLGAFEAYLATFVRYQLRSFRRREARRRYKRFLVEDPEFWQNSGRELQVAAPSVEKRVAYDVSGPTQLLKEAAEAYRASNDRVHTEAFKKRLLFVALKCYLFASEAVLADLAWYLGVELSSLREMMSELRRGVDEREERRRRLEERRNEFAWRLHALRKEIDCYPEEPRRTELRRSVAYYQAKCRALARIIDRIPSCATNKEIARVLGVPKGSVDSGIFYVRKLMRGSGHWSGRTSDIAPIRE